MTRQFLQNRSIVLACSALKKHYRDILRGPHDSQFIFVHLAGSYDVISRRMQTRTGHYIAPALLASQFSALEPPTDAITVSIEQTQDEIVAATDRQLPPL